MREAVQLSVKLNGRQERLVLRLAGALLIYINCLPLKKRYFVKNYKSRTVTCNCRYWIAAKVIDR